MAHEVDGATTTVDESVRSAYVELQSLAKEWMEKEREGISLIESFQTALLATRTTRSTTTSSSEKPSAMAVFLDGTNTSAHMDPWLIENLFAQIRELPRAFTELLERMYDRHHDTQKKLRGHNVSVEAETDGLVLSITDYAQFISHEVATFEAEYQHIEALLAMISFTITTDQLRTLIISWSTSPFLEPEQSREFRQRHDLSQKLRP